MAIDASTLTAPAMPSARALGRVDNWWYSKVAPAIAISYCAALLYQVPAWPTARSIFLIAFVGLCAGSYGHIINDVFDIEVDRNAGKRNHMARFKPWQRFLLCAVTLGLGFAPALFVSYSATSLLLLAVEFLLPTIYSIPPIRLKGRGALGLVCDSLGAHMVPCLYVLSVLAHVAGNPALVHTARATAFVWLTAIWALTLGLIGILIHEFEDRENDLRSGIRTFATDVEFRTVRVPMAMFYVIELGAFAAMATLLFPVAPAIAMAAAVFVLVVIITLNAHWPHYRRYDRDSTAIQWWQLSHPFYEGYLPIAAAIQCALLHPWLAIFPLLHFAVFTSTIQKQASGLEDEFRRSLAWFAWGGRLDIDAGAEAWPLPLPIPFLGGRVRVLQCGSNRWNIRLARPGLAVVAGREYRIRFAVRASRNRNITFGIWQDHAPWEGLGHCEDLPVSTKLQVIQRKFTATADDPSAYFGFWLGGEPGAVDLLMCSIRPTGPKNSVG
jgi:4-hydroxybenzoate polyprenyltransferase